MPRPRPSSRPSKSNWFTAVTSSITTTPNTQSSNGSKRSTTYAAVTLLSAISPRLTSKTKPTDKPTAPQVYNPRVIAGGPGRAAERATLVSEGSLRAVETNRIDRFAAQVQV